MIWLWLLVESRLQRGQVEARRQEENALVQGADGGTGGMQEVVNLKADQVGIAGALDVGCERKMGPRLWD